MQRSSTRLRYAGHMCGKSDDPENNFIIERQLLKAQDAADVSTIGSNFARNSAKNHRRFRLRLIYEDDGNGDLEVGSLTVQKVQLFAQNGRELKKREMRSIAPILNGIIDDVINVIAASRLPRPPVPMPRKRNSYSKCKSTQIE